MLRTSFALTALSVAALVAGCAHGNEAAGTTTVTSGTPSGAKVTGATPKDEAAMRLADEICSREAACSNVGDGAKYRTEEACMADQGATAPVQLSRWSCTPTQTQAGFEECLAAIRSERCETPLPRVDRLVACRSVSVCGR
ncbi:MAG: hypothetical protein JWO86_1552 [Myxococcaceae bacterium]|nr:hypothetical protein [Myxococcaceae bacterium]